MGQRTKIPATWTPGGAPCVGPGFPVSRAISGPQRGHCVLLVLCPRPTRVPTRAGRGSLHLRRRQGRARAPAQRKPERCFLTRLRGSVGALHPRLSEAPPTSARLLGQGPRRPPLSALVPSPEPRARSVALVFSVFLRWTTAKVRLLSALFSRGNHMRVKPVSVGFPSPPRARGHSPGAAPGLDVA